MATACSTFFGEWRMETFPFYSVPTLFWRHNDNQIDREIGRQCVKYFMVMFSLLSQGYGTYDGRAKKDSRQEIHDHKVRNLTAKLFSCPNFVSTLLWLIFVRALVIVSNEKLLFLTAQWVKTEVIFCSTFGCWSYALVIQRKKCMSSFYICALLVPRRYSTRHTFLSSFRLFSTDDGFYLSLCILIFSGVNKTQRPGWIFNIDI